MTPEEMYKAINKGIPNQVRLELNTGTLIKSCASNTGELITSMRKVRKEYEDAIVCIAGYTKSNHEFFDNLRLITNYKTSETSIYCSPVCFIKRLKEILGVTHESIDLDDPELMDALKERLSDLEAIDSIDDLQDEFPEIFEDYKRSWEMMDSIRKEEKINPRTNTDAKRANYHRYGFSYRFGTFLANQKEMYRLFIKYAKDIEEFANTYPIDFANFQGLDIDKFELYIASQYLEHAKTTEEEPEKQASIYYLTSYLNETCGRVISINVDGKEITNVSLLKDFRKFLKENKELKPIHESREVFRDYHIKHVKNHVKKYLNGLENWCVIRISPSELIMNQQARLEAMNKYHEEHPDINDKDKAHLDKEKFMGMLIRKLMFYENSNYSLRLFGIGPFESHVAYFYPNGMVVVDKFYDESLAINPTYDEAIYIMDVDTFLSMITMDKPALRENENVRRIIHAGAWEAKLQEEITHPTITLNSEDVKVLTNRFQTKPTKK